MPVAIWYSECQSDYCVVLRDNHNAEISVYVLHVVQLIRIISDFNKRNI